MNTAIPARLSKYVDKPPEKDIAKSLMEGESWQSAYLEMTPTQTLFFHRSAGKKTSASPRVGEAIPLPGLSTVSLAETDLSLQCTSLAANSKSLILA